jgi:protein-S-isoprenylcysteine O-methyltransferase Ste14
MARQMERWAPLAGIVFVVLMVGGTYLVADVPDPDASQQEIADYLVDGDNHTRNIIGAYVWVLGALLFLWFVTHLRSVLRRAEDGTGILSNLAFGAGCSTARS